MKKAVALLSGGLDSTTLVWELNQQYDVHALSFDYGQRHRKELSAASRIADMLDIDHHIIHLGSSRTQDLPVAPLARVLGGSSLTDERIAVPDGHYAEESMKATVVPNRNAIMLSIAYGVAVAEGAEIVAFAAHAGDHAIYPDCRPAFVGSLNAALHLGNSWDATGKTPEIIAPYVARSKGRIAMLAQRIGVPIADTWSCYKGEDIHCGTCGTCYERREALQEAFAQTGIADPTQYKDSTTVFDAPQG